MCSAYDVRQNLSMDAEIAYTYIHTYVRIKLCQY